MRNERRGAPEVWSRLVLSDFSVLRRLGLRENEAQVQCAGNRADLLYFKNFPGRIIFNWKFKDLTLEFEFESKAFPCGPV